MISWLEAAGDVLLIYSDVSNHCTPQDSFVAVLSKDVCLSRCLRLSVAERLMAVRHRYFRYVISLVDWLADCPAAGHFLRGTAWDCG